jgi:hypothetical protein
MAFFWADFMGLGWRKVPECAWIGARAFASRRRWPRLRALAAWPVWLGLVATYRSRGWAVARGHACALLRPGSVSASAPLAVSAALVIGEWTALLALVEVAGHRLPHRAALICGAAVDAWFLAGALDNLPRPHTQAYRRVLSESGRTGWWIDVLAAWPTGRGAGGALLGAVLDAARQEGSDVWLVSLDGRNRALYERLMTREVSVPLDDRGRDAVLYSRLAEE